MTTVLVPRGARFGAGFTRREQFEARFHPGRRTDGTQTAASWIADLTALKKVIVLCSWCRGKFNPRKHGYRKFYAADPLGITDGYAANGICDGCKSATVNAGGGVAFIHESTYHLACIDPVDARRQARMRARAAWAGARGV